MHPEGEYSACHEEQPDDAGLCRGPARTGAASELPDTTPPATTATTAPTDAASWRACGIPETEAAQWRRAGWRPESAAPWWLLGFTPVQANYVVSELLAGSATWPEDCSTTDFISDCAATNLTAADIVICVATGHLTLDSGTQVAEALTSDPMLRATLRMEAALHGVDPADMRTGTR